MSAILTNGFGNTGILDLRVLSGPDVRPDVIVDYFRNVPVGPNDVLLFYYSGHGATFEGQGHVLTTSHGNLSRDTLRAAVTGRGARLSVLLTDSAPAWSNGAHNRRHRASCAAASRLANDALPASSTSRSRGSDVVELRGNILG